MTIIYTYKCSYTGLTYRCKASGVESVQDETYPPGGLLRVCRNAKGQALCGPLVSEITYWEIAP